MTLAKSRMDEARMSHLSQSTTSSSGTAFELAGSAHAAMAFDVHRGAPGDVACCVQSIPAFVSDVTLLHEKDSIRPLGQTVETTGLLGRADVCKDLVHPTRLAVLATDSCGEARTIARAPAFLQTPDFLPQDAKLIGELSNQCAVANELIVGT